MSQKRAKSKPPDKPTDINTLVQKELDRLIPDVPEFRMADFQSGMSDALASIGALVVDLGAPIPQALSDGDRAAVMARRAHLERQLGEFHGGYTASLFTARAARVIDLEQFQKMTQVEAKMLHTEVGKKLHELDARIVKMRREG